MKTLLKRIICIVITIGIILCLLQNVSNVVRHKDVWYRKTTFKENAKDLDVLFLGNSHMANAIFPMNIWNEYGITSYNLGGHGNTIPNSYWVMENAFEYSTPKLVVLDCFWVSIDGKTSETYLHWTFDGFKFSKTKVNAVKDLFDDSDKRMEYLWDFSLYHSRWNEITEDDYSDQDSVHYGGEPRIAVVDQKESIPYESVLKTDIGNTTGTEYLRKTIESCQKKGIDILLTYLPFPANDEYINESKIVADIAKEYHVNYLNFMELGITNYDTDYYDEEGHLNPSGANKVTEYMGKYIKDHYAIEDKRANDRYESWDRNYEGYLDYKIECLKNEKNIDNYIMLLRDDDLSTYIYINKSLNLTEQKKMIKLIENIPIYRKIDKLSKALQSGKEYFLFVDNATHKVQEIIGKEQMHDLEKALKDEMIDVNKAGIQIITISDVSREVVDTAWFRCEEQETIERK